MAPAPSVAVASERPPQLPLPRLFRCARYDGQESYVTPDAQPRRYLVPLWAALPEMTGSGAGGVSTSGSSRLGGVAAGYTWVEDRCAAMSRMELCAHWKLAARSADQRRDLAFNAERAVLDADLAGLRQQLKQHC